MRRIEPHSIWIGHAGDGRNFRVLFEEGIRAVIQLALEEPPLAAPRELVVIRVPLIDGGNEQEMLRLAVATVEQIVRSGLPTLICCGAGMSRSPAVTAVALSRLEGRSPADCLKRITLNSPADVSTSLWKQLSEMTPLQGDA
jgi:protein-tyrosine phosphatase